MRTYVCREDLIRDVMEYAVCAGRPIWLARHKAIEVMEKIPEGVVRCRDCEHAEGCQYGLGPDGFCSKGTSKKN